jgi:RNA polymerase sigma-70 factor (ECF subfamily)
MDEIAAIHQMKAGDFGGLESLMARYQVKATRAAFLITQDKARAEDAVQEVFLRIFRYANRFDETRPFEPYLMRSVINAALNACRREKRFISLEGNVETVERLVSQAVSVESQAEYSQLKREILDALRQLPPRQRAAVVQRYYLDMSEQEMALALNAAPGTVKWLLNAARTTLRKLLKKERI